MNLEQYWQSGHLQWATYLVAFAVVGIWETVRPLREATLSTPRRWIIHGLLLAIGNAGTLFVFRTGSILVAMRAAASGSGLLNHGSIPFPLRFLAAVLLLDLTRYAIHYLLHHVGALWRIHQIHHADPDYDLTAGLRFHPFELLIEQAGYLLVVLVTGAPVLAVVSVELATIAQNFVVHANASLPRSADTMLRRILITPDMHRTHHSAEPSEQNTNFGAIFPWWDYLFGTYRAEPSAGQGAMLIGLKDIAPQDILHLGRILWLPVRGTKRRLGTSPGLPGVVEGSPRER